MQHLAIALSVSCSMVLNFLFLSSVLYVKTNGYSVSYLVRGVCKICMAGAVMAGFLFWSRSFLNPYLTGNLLQSVSALACIIGIAAFLYGALLQLAKLDEFTSVTSKIYARFKR